MGLLNTTTSAILKVSTDMLSLSRPYAEKIINALNESPSQFHAVQYCRKTLLDAKFKELKEVDKWKIEAGKNYFFTRNNSSLMAFTTGRNLVPEPIDSFKIIGAHLDSPCLKLSTNTKVDKLGYR
jgi:aspartyl aminopeptidase